MPAGVIFLLFLIPLAPPHQQVLSAPQRTVLFYLWDFPQKSWLINSKVHVREHGWVTSRRWGGFISGHCERQGRVTDSLTFPATLHELQRFCSLSSSLSLSLSLVSSVPRCGWVHRRSESYVWLSGQWRGRSSALQPRKSQLGHSDPMTQQTSDIQQTNIHVFVWWSTPKSRHNVIHFSHGRQVCIHPEPCNLH